MRDSTWLLLTDINHGNTRPTAFVSLAKAVWHTKREHATIWWHKCEPSAQPRLR